MHIDLAGKTQDEVRYIQIEAERIAFPQGWSTAHGVGSYRMLEVNTFNPRPKSPSQELDQHISSLDEE
jgi:hypothetical protein